MAGNANYFATKQAAKAKPSTFGQPNRVRPPAQGGNMNAQQFSAPKVNLVSSSAFNNRTALNTHGPSRKIPAKPNVQYTPSIGGYNTGQVMGTGHPSSWRSAHNAALKAGSPVPSQAKHPGGTLSPANQARNKIVGNMNAASSGQAKQKKNLGPQFLKMAVKAHNFARKSSNKNANILKAATGAK
jgi:hypothetical protein